MVAKPGSRIAKTRPRQFQDQINKKTLVRSNAKETFFETKIKNKKKITLL